MKKFLEEHTPTIVETYVDAVYVDATKVEFVIWDTAGQEEYERLRPLFYRDADIILICYSIDNKVSLENIIDKWHPDLKYFCPKTPTILIGTKKDLRENAGSDFKPNKKYKLKDIKYEEGHETAVRIKAHAFFECSCKTFEGVDQIFEAAARCMLSSNEPRRVKKKCCCVLL